MVCSFLPSTRSVRKTVTSASRSAAVVFWVAVRMKLLVYFVQVSQSAGEVTSYVPSVDRLTVNVPPSLVKVVEVVCTLR